MVDIWETGERRDELYGRSENPKAKIIYILHMSTNVGVINNYLSTTYRDFQIHLIIFTFAHVPGDYSV
jgi:hypothetical protein